MRERSFGVIGLGVMGRNLALNIERNGYSVVGFDLSEEARAESAKRFEGKNIEVVDSLSELVEALERPRRILMMVPAGNAVDSVIEKVRHSLTEEDILIDGGNSFFKDTQRRARQLEEKGLRYVGAGISGGEEGALFGPSIMPGGTPGTWSELKEILQAVAAKADDGEPCCEWMGVGGAGHFVKMVHNGIEYADMQMITEAYFLMDRALGLSSREMAEIFDQWNQGELNSYLIEITRDILRTEDKETGRPIVEVILDTAGQKGTGKWTSKIALDLGAPAPTIGEAVFSRFLSALKRERVAAEKVLQGPPPPAVSPERVSDHVDRIRQALYASKICSYAQGFQLLRFASEEYDFEFDFGSVASIWRAGCIIRAQFLNKIKEAYDRDPKLANLLLDSYFREAVESSQEAWRTLVAQAVEWGIPIPAFSSSVAYYDSYRTGRLPANLLQAQRDYFGAHTYERIDRPRGEFFHTEWESSN